jgi:hypothetical protein
MAIFGKKKFTSKRRGNEVHTPGRYFIFTFFYALYFLVGAIAGYSKGSSKICLFGSGSCGIVTLLIGTAHCIDYYRGNVAIEKVYLLFPLLISLAVALLMSCFYGLGAAFMPSGFVAICCWIAAVFYIYAVVKDIGANIIDPSFRSQEQIKLARRGNISSLEESRNLL